MPPDPRCFWLLPLALVVLLRASPALADEAPYDPANDARAAFLEGASLVEEARWAEALVRFERSAKLRPHPVTTYNVAACLRALGAYTHAKRRYAEALRASAALPEGEALTPQVKAEIEGLHSQLDASTAKVDVTIDPVPARMLIDGRPLHFERPDLALAGVREPGAAERVTVGRFVLELDPGVHTVTVQREGHADALVTFTTRAGERTARLFKLDRMPSTLRIESNREDTVVRVDEVDVGIAPVTLTRPPGAHRIVLLKAGFVTFDTRIATRAGEDVHVAGSLERTPLTKKWWFWTAIAGSLVAAGAVSYAVVRGTQEPEVAPFDGGTLGWTVPAP